MKFEMMLKLRFLAALLLSAALLGCGSPASNPQLSERQQTAQAMFAERCKKAGEKIYRTVDNVEGIFLMKLRPGPVNFGDQFKMDDPYGKDGTGNQYILQFLRGYYKTNVSEEQRSKPGAPSLPKEYSYVEFVNPSDGARHRYVGEKKAIKRKDVTAPNVQLELRRDPHYDLNVYEFVLKRIPIANPGPRFGVTYDDISTREEREYWIAGSSLKVVDLQTNEVIAERIGYMMDWAQGSTVGGRSPWLFAADTACPEFRQFPGQQVKHGASYQPGQTLRFLEKVLKPKEEK